jgi:hypothetical protein
MENIQKKIYISDSDEILLKTLSDKTRLSQSEFIRRLIGFAGKVNSQKLVHILNSDIVSEDYFCR